MNKTLTALYDSFYTPPQAADIREEIKTIHKQLILKLDKPEQRLVLRLIDTKDRLAEETSMDSFVCGFHLVWRLANELDSYPESGRPAQSGQTERDARCTPQERWELPDEGLTPPRPWPPLVGRCVAAAAPSWIREKHRNFIAGDTHMDTIAEQIQRRRTHGLYLSRKCGDITRRGNAEDLC